MLSPSTSASCPPLILLHRFLFGILSFIRYISIYYFLLRFLDDRRLRRWGLGYVGGRHDAGRGRNKILTSTTCKKILTKVFCYQNLLRKNRKKKDSNQTPALLLYEHTIQYWKGAVAEGIDNPKTDNSSFILLSSNWVKNKDCK